MKFQALITKFLGRTFYILVFGFILTTALGLVIQIPVEQYINLFIILLVIYTSIVIVTITFKRRNIDDQLSQIGLASLWMTEQTESNEGYIKSRDVVLSAKESILVLSHYIPEGFEVEFSETRKSYLIDGIEGVIKSRLEQTDAPPLTYLRIIQSNKFTNTTNTLNRSMIPGDDQTFGHCKRVFKMMENKFYNNVHVDFRISEPIPSFPNMLIVDSKYMLFALSTRAPRLSTSKDKYVNVGVFLVEDRSGKTIRGFVSSFHRFFENSSPILTIDDSDDTV